MEPSKIYSLKDSQRYRRDMLALLLLRQRSALKELRKTEKSTESSSFEIMNKRGIYLVTKASVKAARDSLLKRGI